MRTGRTGKLVVAGVSAAVACGLAAPVAQGGTLPTKVPVINPVKVGKYRVTPEGGGSTTNVRYTKGTGSVSYQGTGAASSDQVSGDFGDFGKIDVTFHKSGPFKNTKLPKGCHGTPSKKQKGVWKGKFKADGEGRLPKVSRSSLPGSIVKFGDFTCNGTFPKYVNLNSIGWTDISFGVSVRKAGGKPGFYVSMNEAAHGAQISRSTFYRGKPSEFTYAGNYSSAKVKPKGPFSGKAKYAAQEMRGPSQSIGELTGNLKVALLGKGSKVAVPSGPASLGEDLFRPAR